MKTTIIITSILTVIILSVIIFINQPSFGRLPRGERKARIEQSPNYMNGAFRNRESTIMTTEKSRLRLMTDFVLGRKMTAYVRTSHSMSSKMTLKNWIK